MPDNSVLRPHGLVIVTDLDGNETVRDTLQCVHCQAHWVVVKGSGRRRGWCMKCGGPTCGAHACEVGGCVPKEAALEAEEKRYGELARSIQGNFVPSASGILTPK